MRRVAFKALYALIGEDLAPCRNCIIEVLDNIVDGIGTQAGTHNVISLGESALMPQFTNAHIHVLDAALHRYFRIYYIDDLVGAPYSVKYALLRRLNPKAIYPTLRTLFQRLKLFGIGHVMAVVEYGLRFYEVVERAAQEAKVELTAFLEPSTSRIYVKDEDEVDEKFEEEVKEIAELSRGISLVSPLNYTKAELRLTASIAARKGIPIMTHVSETPDTYEEGDLKRALILTEGVKTILVHLTQLREDEVWGLPRIPIAICPRSNLSLVNRLPPIHALIKGGFKPMLGTDNVGLVEPCIHGELEALTLYSNVNPHEALKMACSNAHYHGFGFVIDLKRPFRAIAIRLWLVPEEEGIFDYMTRHSTLLDIMAVIDGVNVTRPNNSA